MKIIIYKYKFNVIVVWSKKKTKLDGKKLLIIPLYRGNLFKLNF